MNRSERARQVALQTGLLPAADAALKAALGAVAGAQARGEAVRLVGFGTFGVRALGGRRTGAALLGSVRDGGSRA